MKFIANENIPKYVCDNLVKQGIDVVNVVKLFPGAKDKTIIEYAIKENRIILTFDRDFGEFIFKEKFPVRGVILLRFSPKSPEFILQKINNLLKTPEIELENNFIVVEEDKVRVRKIR